MAETQTSSCEQTRSRLLEAAREIFSQCGFQGATVREICRRADANVAAVNYHFGSKDGLLAEALNFSALKTLQSANIAANTCPEMRLRLFIRDFMLLLLDDTVAPEMGSSLVALYTAPVTVAGPQARTRAMFSTEVCPAVTSTLPVV